MGGYGFDPQEDDDLEQFIAARAAQARPEFTPPPVAPMEPRGSLSSLIAPRDPEMDSRWRGAEQQALDRSGFGAPQSYGVAEGVRDFAPMAIGSLAALLTGDKGRSIPYLAGAGMQANALQQRNRDARAAQAGDFALSARNQRESLGRQGVAAATEARQQEQFDLLNNPDNPQAQAFRESVYARSPSLRGKLDGLTLNQMKQLQGANQMVMRSDFTPQLAQDAGQVAEQRKRGTYRAEDEHYPTELDQKAGIAGAESDARIQAQLGQAPALTAAEVAKQQAMIPGKVAEKVAYEDAGVGAGQGYAGHMSAEDLMKSNPGLTFTNPKLIQDALRTRALTKDVVAQIQAANRGAGVIDELYKSTAEAQDAMKRGDIEGAYAARKQALSHAEEYAGILGKVTGSSSMEQQRRAMDLVPSVLNPMALEGIKALWPSIAVNVKGNLGTYGIEARTPSVIGGEQPQNSPRASPPGNVPPAPGPASKYTDPGYGPDVLDVNGPRGVRNTPDFPGGAPVSRLGGKPPGDGGGAQNSGGFSIARQNQDGSFDIDGYTYTADEVQRLRAMGKVR